MSILRSEPPAASAVIWGAAGHALVVTDIIQLQGQYAIRGYLDDLAPGRAGELFCGRPVLGGRGKLPELRAQNVTHICVAIGENGARAALAAVAVENGFELATAIHPAAVVAGDVVIGAGTVVMAGVVINSGTRIGTNVIVNTSASIDHECELGDSAHVSPGVHLGGGVRVGAGAWIGIGASVSDHVTIGAGTIIGAGAVVLSDIPAGVVAYGVPARPQRAV